jgi:Glycine cleavage T-protein C-terminal barrel domain
MVGRAASGAYGYTVGKSLAVGYVEPDVAATGTKLEIEILSERFPVRVIPESPWDPENARLWGVNAPTPKHAGKLPGWIRQRVAGGSVPLLHRARRSSRAND